MHIRCKTEQAILLLGVESKKGFLVFPSNSSKFPGMLFTPEGGKAILEQLDIYASEILTSELAQGELEICDRYFDIVTLDDGSEATLYLATVRNRPELIQNSWSSLPEQLRKMPKDKGRLPFLRAWQVLTGALDLNTKAVETQEPIN
ncbi:MAG: hypothetical protein R3B45_03905 [Bdellovibrionota bacterium]